MSHLPTCLSGILFFFFFFLPFSPPAVWAGQGTKRPSLISCHRICLTGMSFFHPISLLFRANVFYPVHFLLATLLNHLCTYWPIFAIVMEAILSALCTAFPQCLHQSWVDLVSPKCSFLRMHFSWSPWPSQ